MTRFSRPLLLLASFLVLAGCWQSQHGALYGKIDTITPFRTGNLIATGADKPEGFAITIKPDGGYSLISTERDEKGQSDGFNLRFFAIPGLPRGVLAYEAISLTHCDTKFICDAIAAADDRYYGLVRPTQDGAEEIRPDCDKDARFIDKTKIKIDDGVCTFPDRATLETALRALAADSNRKPDRVFRYH